MMKIETSIIHKIMVLFTMALLITSCKDKLNKDDEVFRPGPDAYENIQNALLDAEPGDVIELGAGTFNFSSPLSMDGKTGITFTGNAQGQTTLSFEDQAANANGFHITNSDQIVVKDITISNAPGDALKFQNSDGIVILRVRTVWDEPGTENGSYGIYPVLSSNILIDDCYAYGASDAGIYVGQSENAVIRNSRAESNVAGIEIENTINADVYGNNVNDNSGGILVFDLPGLSQSGSHVRVLENVVMNNNRSNFAPSGSIVAEVPAGTGILVMSNDYVEIFDNDIDENNVIGTGVFSYNAMIALGVASTGMDPSYNPSNIYIHNNEYSRSDTYVPEEDRTFVGNMLISSFGDFSIPDVMLDGFFAAETGASGSICIENNTGNQFVNLNIPNDFPNQMSFDPVPHNCSMDPLPEAVVEIPDF